MYILPVLLVIFLPKYDDILIFLKTRSLIIVQGVSYILIALFQGVSYNYSSQGVSLRKGYAPKPKVKDFDQLIYNLFCNLIIISFSISSFEFTFVTLRMFCLVI